MLRQQALGICPVTSHAPGRPFLDLFGHRLDDFPEGRREGMIARFGGYIRPWRNEMHMHPVRWARIALTRNLDLRFIDLPERSQGENLLLHFGIHPLAGRDA